jgi:hypothetical protein
MGGKYWSGEKASKEEAERKLETHVRGVYDKIFAVRFASDDGGNVIELVIERENPKEQIEAGLRSLLDFGPKWMGWRAILVKVPPGYIDCFILNPRKDDY